MSDVAFGLSGPLLAAAAAAAACFTAWRVDVALSRRADADSLFWLIFPGVFTVIALAAAGAGSPGGKPAILAVLLVASILAVYVALRQRRRVSGRAEAAAETEWASLRLRHETAVRRWIDYELDPGKAIAYPAMSDPSRAASRRVLAALRDSDNEWAARAAGGSNRHTGFEVAGGYLAAVRRFEHALVAAEREAGVALPAGRAAPSALLDTASQPRP